MSELLRILIGGSPCTYWSIAQTKSRETEAEGMGWELFKNYVIARDKYQPDLFLYENNKSMAAAIRAQITEMLGFPPVLINSSLVSAQSRQRLYWVGKRNPDGTYSQVTIKQPEDRGIILRDILESGLPLREKGYTLKANYANAGAVNSVCGQHFPAPMAAEPVNVTEDGKAHTLRVTCYKDGIRNMVGNTVDLRICVAEPVRIGTIESDAKNAAFDSQQYRVYSPDGKSVTLCGQGGGVGAKTGLYAVPAAGRIVGRRINKQGHRDDYNEAIPHFQYFEVNSDPQKTNCLTTVQKDNMIAVPAGYYGHNIGLEIKAEDGKTYPVYEVRGGKIAIRGKEYPIKLADGLYIIRKLTVTECKRLQTVPESYVFPVSDTQAYKMLGNGWTVDVIAHILANCPGITSAPLEVMPMYDGMSCGHIALDKLGGRIVRYFATEIDKYAIKTTQHNFPATIQLGDAFQVRDAGWAPWAE